VECGNQELAVPCPTNPCFAVGHACSSPLECCTNVCDTVCSAMENGALCEDDSECVSGNCAEACDYSFTPPRCYHPRCACVDVGNPAPGDDENLCCTYHADGNGICRFGAQGEYCEEDEQCLSNVCNESNSQCSCSAFGANCAEGYECCSGLCNGDTCYCRGNDEECTDGDCGAYSEECCSHYSQGGYCRCAPPQYSCSGEQNFCCPGAQCLSIYPLYPGSKECCIPKDTAGCSAGGDCCTANCAGGICGCAAESGPCLGDSDCCLNPSGVNICKSQNPNQNTRCCKPLGTPVSCPQPGSNTCCDNQCQNGRCCLYAIAGRTGCGSDSSLCCQYDGPNTYICLNDRCCAPAGRHVPSQFCSNACCSGSCTTPTSGICT
jgi:hypothetical protein